MSFITRKRILLLTFIIVLLFLILRYPVYNAISFMNQKAYLKDGKVPVIVTVFYETLCPDSKHFIDKQLIPAYKKSSPIMEVILRPYGKAQTHINDDGSYRFDCQHGTIECQGNKYHACVADIIKDDFKRLEMIGCMFKDMHNPKNVFQECVKQLHIENVDLIQKCYDGTIGDELLKLHGEATHALRPPVTFIPTVTLDGSQGRQADILKDLLAELCKIVGQNFKAKIYCENYV